MNNCNRYYTVLYEQSKNLDGQNQVVSEMEKIDTEYSNIIDQAIKKNKKKNICIIKRMSLQV